MSKSPSPSSQRPFYNTNSSSSTSQLHNFTSRSSLAGSSSSTGPAQGFFDRHNFFGRNSRPRTSAGVGGAGAAAVDTNPAGGTSTTVANSSNNSNSAQATPTRRPTSSRSTSHTTGLFQQSPERHRGTEDHRASPHQSRVGFPSSSSALRSPHDEYPQDNNAAAAPVAASPSTGRRLFGMAGMTRTNSSGGNSISAFAQQGGAAGGGAAPSAPSPAPSERSGSAFGRMFRRYSHGQGRANSNATDPSTIPGGFLPHSSSSSSFATRPSTTQNDGSSFGNSAQQQPQAHPAASSAASLSQPAARTSPSAASDVPEQPAVAPAGTNPSVQAGLHRIRLVPHLEATRSLHFEPIERDVREGAVAVKIGRFTDRHPPPAPPPQAAAAASSVDDSPQAAALASVIGNAPAGSGPGNRGGAVPTSAGGGGRIDSTRIAFKSKVVSRGHAEVWCEPGGKFFIRDTKSSSGTFLNHIRLSAPNVESRPFAIKDGDILQLGVDYQGGTEEIYRCVKIRVELNRGWQREANQFNVNALRQLRALQGSPIGAPSSSKPSSEAPSTTGGGGGGAVAVAAAATATALPTNRQSMSVTDCCICLFSVTVCQALFIAPCSHVFHYKCIRPLLNQHHPGFSCPLCRTFADLEADVEQDEAWQEALLKEAEAIEATRSGSTNSGPVAAGGSALTTTGGGGGGSGSSQGHGGDGARGGTASATPSQEIAGLELGQNGTQADGVTPVVAPHVGGALHGGPAVSSPLRQQIGRSVVMSGQRLGTADRPSTAVGDGPPPGASSYADYDQTMTAIGAGGAMVGRHDDLDDEAEEVLDEGRISGSHLHGHEIDRISEEGERSEASMDGSNTSNASYGNAMQRRPSQPINIAGSGGDGVRGNSHYASLSGYSGFSPMDESRTPVNQHVLSVLAEAPPPGSMAARRFAEHQQQQRRDGGGDRRPSAVPSEDLHFETPAEGTSPTDRDLSGGSGRRRSSGHGQQSHTQHRPTNRYVGEGGRSSSTFTTTSSGEGDEGDDVDEDDDDVVGPSALNGTTSFEQDSSSQDGQQRHHRLRQGQGKDKYRRDGSVASSRSREAGDDERQGSKVKKMFLKRTSGEEQSG